VDVAAAESPNVSAAVSCGLWTARAEPVLTLLRPHHRRRHRTSRRRPVTDLADIEGLIE
jgi:hypothetical protein